jgi:hypothetical protein
MIIQTGMRTDIPAFYSKWLINRLKEGFVLVRNPYNQSQVTRYRLTPDVVDLMAFCTKNPSPMLPVIEECYEQCKAHEHSSFAACSRTISADKDTPHLASRFGLPLSTAALLVDSSFWFVTITPYGSDVEPHVPDKEKVMEDFRRLSDMVGVVSMGWRYDPIFVDDDHSVAWHISEFEKMAKSLAGYTEICVISFIDIYKKVQRNFPSAKPVPKEERLLIGKAFIEIARDNGMTIRPCAEGDELAKFGADCSGCMTKPTFENVLQCRLDVPPMKSNQRNGECACLLGVDIGAYDTCGHLCKYCYANSNPMLVRENMKKHNPDSPFLIGESRQGDVIHEAKQKSWIDRQLRFEF